MTAESSSSLRRRAWGVLSRSVVLGGRSGLRTVRALLLVMVPVMLLMTALEALGVLPWIAWVFRPVTHLVGLPGDAALALVSGAALNVYTAVAVAANVTLSVKQLTILAVLCLDFHNLPVECAVQKKSGTGVAAMLAVRFLTALGGAMLFSWLIPNTDAWTAPATHPGAAAAMSGTLALLRSRLVQNAWLLGKVVLIVTALMITVEFLRQTGLLSVLAWLMRPLTWIAGLPRMAAFTVMASSTLGLAYASGIVIDESRKGHLTGDEQFRTNVFIGTTHSIFEDTLLFVVIGAGFWWIFLGRLALGCVAVRIFALIRRLRFRARA